MWNPRTSRTYRDFAALLAPNGATITLEGVVFSTPHDDGRSPIPSVATVRFAVPENAHGVAQGKYEVVFEHTPEFDWTVPYACPLGWVCLAHEAHCRVDVVRDGIRAISGSSGAQETIDLVRSLAPDTEP
jgi:hypothetical protein